MKYEPIVSTTGATAALAALVYEATGSVIWGGAVFVGAFLLWRIAHAVAAATKTEADDRALAAFEGEDDPE